MKRLVRTSFAAVLAVAIVVGALAASGAASDSGKSGPRKAATTRTRTLAAKVKRGPRGPRGPRGFRGRSGPQGPTGKTGETGPAGTGASLAIQVASSGVLSDSSPTSFVNLAGATTSITVPVNTTAMILARFTAESSCSAPGVAVQNWCSVRILVDGVEAQPAVGNNFAFDSTDEGNETVASWESHSVDRYAAGVGPGAHSVTVQEAVTSAATVFQLDDWTLVVEAFKTA
jgi:hypothetical protein